MNSDEYDEIYSKCEAEKRARTALNAKWLKLWEMYKTRPLRNYSNGEWKSNLNDGRVFELIETVGSYLRNALFFSDNWVELQAAEPGLAEVLPLVNVYFRDSLNKSNFKQELRLYLQQLLLLGFSAMSITWDKDQGLVFECLNAYDTYIESSRRYNSKFSYVFYEYELNLAQFKDFIDRGVIDLKYSDEEDLEEQFENLCNEQRDLDDDDYLKSTIEVEDEKLIRITEYYCPIENAVYIQCGCTCLGESTVDECPWLVSTLFETPEDSYGLSIIESSIGLILENNILMNRRLDNMAVSVDNMWMFIDDGVTNPDDLVAAPGKVIQVGRPDAVTPLHPPTNNFNVTYQEASVLDAKIDRNIGTGAMISANTYRSGERVTAQEITSVKEAGGNRLSDVYELIEDKCIMPMLQRAYKLLRKHTKGNKIIKIQGGGKGVADYFKMLPKDLAHDYTVRLTATQSVINRDRNIKYLTDFLTLVANVPQFEPFINFENVYYDLLVKFGFDDPTRYLKKAEEPTTQGLEPPQPTSPMDALMQGAQQVGGAPMAQAMTQSIAGGQLPDMARNMMGATPGTEQLDPAMAAAAMSTPLPM